MTALLAAVCMFTIEGGGVIYFKPEAIVWVKQSTCTRLVDSGGMFGSAKYKEVECTIVRTSDNNYHYVTNWAAEVAKCMKRGEP